MTLNKIMSIEDIAVEVSRLNKEGKRVVHCHGCFDLMHPGHIRHFKGAKAYGDILVVTVSPDRYVDKGPNRPVFNEQLRAESIASLEFVDFVGINEWPTAEETLRLIKPNIYVKGQEFEGKVDSTGKLQREKKILEEIGAEMRFTHDIVFSSTKLLNSNFGLMAEELVNYLEDFKNQFSTDELLSTLSQLSKLNILVIGDAIIDDYHYCQPLNKASKASAIAAKYLKSEKGIGGALCIANHLSHFCRNVTIMTSFGDKDDHLIFTKERLPKEVNLVPYIRKDSFTTLKRRFVDNVFLHKLLEIHFYDDSYISPELEEEVISFLQRYLCKYDLVIVGDFGHGFMTPSIIEYLTGSDAHLSVTVQTNSNNFGFNYVTKYSRADYVAIDANELRLACQDPFAPLEQLLERLMASRKYDRFAVTLGREGSMSKENGQFIRAPIVSTQVVDTIGAGDAFLALSAPLAALNRPPRMQLFFGNVAGAIAANIVGNNEAITKSEFRKYLLALLK